MAKVFKDDGAIFPMPPKKTGYETEHNKAVSEDKSEELSIAPPLSDESIVNTPYFTEKSFIPDKVINESHPAIRPAQSYDEVATEEIIVRIVDELILSEKMMVTLSERLALRLTEQLNTNEIISFISKNAKEGLNPESIHFKEHLLKYTVMLQEQIGASIKQITSDLFLKGKNL